MFKIDLGLFSEELKKEYELDSINYRGDGSGFIEAVYDNDILVHGRKETEDGAFVIKVNYKYKPIRWQEGISYKLGSDNKIVKKIIFNMKKQAK